MNNSLIKQMLINKLAIYSPAACGSIGHGLVYALNICKNLNDKIDYSLFTIAEPQCIKTLLNNGINVTTSKEFKSGVTNKKNFLKYGIFSKVVYGVYRIYYHITLLKEFYRANPAATHFHLFEFEYIAALIFFAFNKKKLRNTILSFHSSDFYWIRNRSFTINFYKLTLKFFLPYLAKNAFLNITHGEFLKMKLIKSLKLRRYSYKVMAIPYGCNDNIEAVSLIEARKLLDLDENKKYGLFFGVLREDKGLIELIKALPKVDNELNLIIVGAEGDIKKALIIKLIDKLKLKDRVILNINYLSEKEIQLYYSASDIIFITHKSHHVAFSGPLSLAVEFKRPVISTDFGEMGAFVKKYNIGQTFISEDWNDFINVTNVFIYKSQDINGSVFSLCLNENSWQVMSNQLLDAYVQE